MTALAGQLDALEDSMLQAGRPAQEIRQARRAHLASLIEAEVSPETPGEANLDRAKAMFPAPSDEDLVNYLGKRTDVLHAMLGDIYIVTTYDNLKKAGNGRDGRRTMPSNANLPDLWDMITPRYSQHPFGLAVKELIGERSLRQFAGKVPMDHRELSRMIRGASSVTPYVMEQIAKAANVQPSFFLEYRIGYVQTMLAEVMAAKPNLSVQVFRRLRETSKLAANGR